MNSQTSPDDVHLNPLSSSDDPMIDEYDKCSEATLKFINDVLMEEDDLENMPYMLHDSLALLATEKSFRAVLNNNDVGENLECLDQLAENEGESSEMYDNVMLSSDTNQLMMRPCSDHSQSGRAKNKAVAIRNESADLRDLLLTCAQALSTLDTTSAAHLLLQIRPHCSPLGNSLQRVSHYLANALEARLNGTGTALYSSLNRKRRSASSVLKAFRMCITVLPIKKMLMLLANKEIEKLATGATTLHIIDFGILYGFQWPRLIQILSERHGGPPKLRITGIEFPQKGDPLAESLAETGRRLARYCERFGVPFEYNAIAKNWETIRVGDLKIKKDELLVVNSMLRFQNLLDETVIANNPRDAVLYLIKNINPAIFIHGISNGQCSSPFFATRFKQALFYYSNMFDMIEATVVEEEEIRLICEEDVLGKMAMNMIASEGTERIERPESYKQWKIRMQRAGFRQLMFDQETVRYVKSAVKKAYHKDSFVDEDGKWLLLGWKGRVNEAMSCWKPIHN